MHMSTKGTRCSLSRLVAAVAAVVAFALLAVPLGVAYAADSVVDTINVNHVRTATMGESGHEADLTAAKAGDGNAATRWSSGEAKPEKNESTYLSATFDSATLIKRVEVTFENRDVDIKPSNVKGFELQYQDGKTDEWKTAQVVENTKSGSTNGYSTTVSVELKDAITAKAIRLTKFDIVAGSTQWNGVSVVELEAYSNEKLDVEEAENVNHVLASTMSASGQEADTLTPNKAGDGDDGTRWSSGTQRPNKDESTFLASTFKKATKVRNIKVAFETRTVDVKPSNVKAFDIQYKAPGSDTWTKLQTVNNTQSGSGYSTKVNVLLDQDIVATAIRLTNFDIATVASQTQWNGVSVVELEAYSNDRTAVKTLDQVVSELPNNVTVEAGEAKIPLPSVPEGFTVKLNGCDFEQVVAADRTIVHPLTDKSVVVSWTVTETKSGTSKTSGDLTYVIKGKNTQAEGKNAKPVVVPEIQEWFSDSTAKVAADRLTKVTYQADELKAVVEEFVADYKDFTGIELKVVKGAAQAGAFNFTFGEPENDPILGDEGYVMNIKADRIDVQSESVTGNMYGMQTILQMTKTETDGFPVGQIRDYPRFPVRGFMWDIARKPISLEMVEMAARTMRYYKMNDFQLHLSDNLIFLENYKSDDEALEKAYAAFRLESSVRNEATGETATAKDYFITKDEMRSFIKTQRSYGMNIVPEIDMPAHAVAFTRAFPELAVMDATVTTRPKDRWAVDHLDLRNPKTMPFIKSIFDDYTTGDNEVFDDETVVHIGADEFIIPNGRPVYCEFYNDLVPHLQANGNTPRVWGSFDSSWLAGGGIEPADGSALCTGVQMDIWSLGWANPIRMHQKGFSLINILDSYGYMVPNGGGNRGAYGDYLNTKSLYKSFDPNNFGGRVLPASDPKILGAEFAIWNDNIDTNACGLTEADEYARFFDAMPVYAENNWAPTGQEKGAGDAGHENLYNIVKKTGDAPRVNPYSKVSKKGDTYAEYDFEKGLADKSQNGRNLSEGAKAQVKKGELVLEGGASYVTSPIQKIATGTELSFDITLDEPACPGDVLFEADAPYGTLDIRVMDNGKLGFTRELYDYYFDYKLPVGKKVSITLRAETQKTTLFVDGEKVGTATGRFFDHGMVKKDGIGNATFTMPLERIGSKENGIAARIDNVVVKPAKAEEVVDQYNKKGWTAKTNSQTLTGESAGGHIEHAFDNNASTIWHSNWKDATAENKNGKLDVTNPIWVEIDFGKGYEINQFSFTPRAPQASGQVTKANVYIKTAKDGEWQEVAKDATFKADSSKKTVTFAAQTVFCVRFEATQSNDNWVAVSEFDIANKPAPTNSVYVASKSYVAAEDGTLDLTTGKAVDSVVSGTAEDLDDSKSVYRAEVKGGTELTLTAKPGEKLEFVGWFVPGSDELVSEDLSYKVPTDYNVALEARFKRVEGGTAPEAIIFNDVHKDTPHKDDITWLAQEGISSGWENADGSFSFRPYETVKRCDMAAFLYRAAGSPAFDESQAPTFTDVVKDTPHRKAILWLAAEGISKGWDHGDGTAEFRPYADVARCDMAAFLGRLVERMDVDESKLEGFVDLQKDTPHIREVSWLISSGVSEGWTMPDGAREFRPYAQVTRCDMAAFLHRLMESSYWPY